MTDKKKSKRGSKPATEDFVFEISSPVTVSSGMATSGPLRKFEAGEVKALKTAPALTAEKVKMDPLLRMLAEAKLPALPKQDRARLQMQSPNRIYFYWSVKKNPFSTLKKAFGGQTGSYTLVAKLRNMTTGSEKMFPVEPAGNWWFDVDSDNVYRAEIGFYAPNRPYVRIVFSNELHTPRKTPSTRTDYTPSFSVTANEFAEALDAAGYRRDAFDVALAGDDAETAEKATLDAYFALTGKKKPRVSGNAEAELRFVLLALASGYTLEEIRNHIDPTLFELIKSDLEGLTAEAVMSALKERFEMVSTEIEEIEELGSAVYGASLVHFPKAIRKRVVPRSLMPKLGDLERLGGISSPVKR